MYTSGRIRPRPARMFVLQVLGQARLLGRAHEQAELGTAPEDVFGAGRPFLLAEIVHFPCIEAGAQVFAEVSQFTDVAQQVPAAAAVEVGPAPGDVGGQPAEAGAELFHQGAAAFHLFATR